MQIPFVFEFQTESTDEQAFHSQHACLMITAHTGNKKLVKQLQHYFSTQVQVDQAEIEDRFGFLDYQAVPGTAFAVSSYDVAVQDVPRVLSAWSRKLTEQGFQVAKPLRLSATELSSLLSQQSPEDKTFIESLSQSPDDKAEALAIDQSLLKSALKNNLKVTTTSSPRPK